jgi:hypothetical protein
VQNYQARQYYTGCSAVEETYRPATDTSNKDWFLKVLTAVTRSYHMSARVFQRYRFILLQAAIICEKCLVLSILLPNFLSMNTLYNISSIIKDYCIFESVRFWTEPVFSYFRNDRLQRFRLKLLPHCVRMALLKGRNRVHVSLLSPGDGTRYPKLCVF